MDREYNNLLGSHAGEVVGNKNARSLFVDEEDFLGTRLVFEWNDSEAEFELQFVNPDNQYYTWKHTLEEGEETIRNEKLSGYSISEYLVDGSLPGKWSVNVNYKGNKSLTPTYLKVTRYENYGTSSQSQEVAVFKLSLKNANQKLFEFNKTGGITSR